ncbi:MAG: hypothetical protein HQM12_05855 [SAR324 cluster bacterium]|nr:hypothetical protein [SAR324 cluster bacterium]
MLALIRKFMILCGGYVLIFFITPNLYAQEGEGGGSTDSYWRLGFLGLTTPRFDTPHPFTQMSGSAAFDIPPFSVNMSLDYRGRLKGQKEETIEQKFVHEMPPSTIEYAFPTDTLINYVSLMYTHVTTYEDDGTVGGLTTVPRSERPIVQMKTYYDLFVAAIHPLFNPNESDIDISVGTGFAKIQGIYRGGFRGSAANHFRSNTQLQRFQAAPVPIRFVAIDTNGETFGFRFSMHFITKTVIIQKDENIFYGNPQAPGAAEEVYFTGLLMSATITAKF